jgi:hypothetical protein
VQLEDRNRDEKRLGGTSDARELLVMAKIERTLTRVDFEGRPTKGAH